MKSGRARPPGAPQQIVAVFLALAVVLTQAYRAWAHCTLTVTANPAKVCVGEETTVTQSGVDCLGQSVNVTNQQSFGSPAQHILCPSPACGGCGIDNCATVMVVAVSGIVPTSATVCAGSSNTFSITIAPPGETLPGDPDWTVTPAGAGSIIGSGTSVVFVAANTGVVATVTAGCGSSSAAATVTILTNHWSGWTVSNAPTISVTATGQEFCVSGVVTATIPASVTTSNGVRYRVDASGCASNEVSDLVFTNVVTGWTVSGANPTNGNGTVAEFPVSNPGVNTVIFDVTGFTADPAGSYTASTTATVAGVSVIIMPTNGWTTCVNSTNTFTATGLPTGGMYSWGSATTNLVWTTAGTNVVSVTYTNGSAVCTAVSTGMVHSLMLTPEATNLCANSSALFVATGLPAGASSYAWNPVGIITNVAGGVSNGNVVAFSTPGLTQLVSVTYGACSVAATVNVFAVQSVAFEEFSAGTTNSVLAANPNAGGGLQIFPDRLTPTDTTNHAVVLVRATVTPPLSNIVVYFTAFDADDPTTNAAPVDNETVLQDNRGSVGGLREGLLAVASALTGTNGVATNLFTVTMQPGDNFRVVAHCDPTFAGGYMAQTNSAGGEIVSTNGVTPIAGTFVTELLTVWRRLHIEVDSMGSVVSNFVAGQITGMTGVEFEGVTSIVSSVNFKTGLSDSSPNLDSAPPRNGRFENGNITVGPSQHFTADLLGNGNTRVAVKSNTYFNIGFILTKGTNSLLGRVVSLRQSPPRFMVKPTIPPGTFNGGSLDVAGHTFSVNSAGGQSIIVNAMLPLRNHNRPFVAKLKGARDENDWRGFAQGSDDPGRAR